MKTIVNSWILGISFILLGASIYLNIGSIVITNEAIVLTFVGILATFIVVGNYAQVLVIKDETTDKINKLQNEINAKFVELEISSNKIFEASKRIDEIEKKITYNSAEAYRLYGIYAHDRKFYRHSTRYLLDSISFYIENDYSYKNESLLKAININLKSENWNAPKSNTKFEYDKYIDLVEKFPDSYTNKQSILDLLRQYKKEEDEK